VALPACVGPKLLGEVQGTQTKLQRAIRDGSKAINCAPKETAIAEANIKFAQDSLAIGEYYRGKQHAEIAAYNTERALQLTNPDRCRGGTVVAVGDKDGDGYDDIADKCPADPEDFDSFEDNDGCPDKDNDNDGVEDAASLADGGWVNNDKKDDLDCRNEAEDKDNFEDQDGCPDPDNDKDGILDGQDKCPNEPEDFDGVDDEDGCPDLQAEFDGCSVKIKDVIYFKFNKSEIDPRSYPLLNDVATVIGSVPATLDFRIEGHTDSKGGNKYNKDLSQRRADAVQAYLVGRGIASNRLEGVGFGEERPIDSNRSAEGRARNRRVEFNVSNADCKRNPQ
jgi:OmpA-OmpF porin, OOP family